MTLQQGDIHLFQTVDGGEIDVTDGIVTMDGGLETTVYLSLFGGNYNDAGDSNIINTFWGNLGEIEEDKKYTSETQFLLKSLPTTAVNLRRIENAILNDLSWVTASGIASSIEVLATIPGVNKIKVNIKIQANGLETEFEFTENWKASL